MSKDSSGRFMVLLNEEDKTVDFVFPQVEMVFQFEVVEVKKLIERLEFNCTTLESLKGKG